MFTTAAAKHFNKENDSFFMILFLFFVLIRDEKPMICHGFPSFPSFFPVFQFQLDYIIANLADRGLEVHTSNLSFSSSLSKKNHSKDLSFFFCLSLKRSFKG